MSSRNTPTMTAVLRSPTHIPSPSSSPLSCSPTDGGRGLLRRRRVEDGVERKEERKGQEDQLSLLTFVLTVLRKSLAGCRTEGVEEELRSMEIGWPTNVRHVAHVTFDRFHGFLGLPVEFEPEVPRRVPSARSLVLLLQSFELLMMMSSDDNFANLTISGYLLENSFICIDS